MKKTLFTLIEKLYLKQWTIGICQDNINDILRNKNFDPNIHWLNLKSFDKFDADPFFLVLSDETIDIIFEEYSFNKNYGNLSIMSLDKNYEELNRIPVLDTQSHLSYPFVYKENNKIYVFPESKETGNLSCYEFVPGQKSLVFIKTIIDLPLVDSTIIKQNNKYYIFSTLSINDNEYHLYVFFSDSLLGPYIAHQNNPVKEGLNGTRSAGNFIREDGILYRPAQNCQEQYGKSITIYKIIELNEIKIVEEPYMEICINNKKNKRINSIHTINIMDNIIVVDGENWSFRPILMIIKKMIKTFKYCSFRKGFKSSKFPNT